MKKVYKCDFCNKIDEEISNMINHESVCNLNPKNKTCLTCEHEKIIKYSKEYYSKDCNIGILNKPINQCNSWILKSTK